MSLRAALQCCAAIFSESGDRCVIWAERVAFKQVLGLAATQAIIFFLLTSCAPAVRPVAAESLPTLTATQSIIVVPEFTPTFISPSTTATQIACDPFVEDFCISAGHFIFQNPIFRPGNTSVDITYRYGSTQDGKRDPHHGVEFLNKFGTPVHAAGDGVVQFAGPDKEALYSPWADFYGNVIVIRHADEMYTLYAHLSKIEVEAGDEVRAGDLIGEVGQSGVATGSHLHFEVRRGGDGTDYFSTQNPELWVIPNKEKGTSLGAMAFSIVDGNSDFQFAEFTARYHLNKNGPKVKSYYVVTYSKDMINGDENAALGDLPPGLYRVALKFNARIYERWVEVDSGKLTQVVFVVE
ncbi:MAG: hypothetical protein C3F07_05810 [Anaerolineales bacterium]|nr:M23 family metallopeptidase [Anaerolineae bacterium]PWB75245.1 MAG: hypothetical protein C3F07_05810 [Anaerolineales bacterium]